MESKRTTLIPSDNLMVLFLYFCSSREDITGARRAGAATKKQFEMKGNDGGETTEKKRLYPPPPPPQRIITANVEKRSRNTANTQSRG